MVALLLAGGYFVLRPDITHFPTRGTAVRLSGIPPMPVAPPAQVAPAPVGPLAPAASLANVPVPPMPTAVIHKKYVPLPFADELAELEHLRAGLQMPIAGKTVPQAPNGAGALASLPKAQAPASTGKQPTSSSVAAEPGNTAATAPLAGPLAAVQRPHAPSSPPVIQTSAASTAATLPSAAPAAFALASPGSPTVVAAAAAQDAVPKIAATAEAAPVRRTATAMPAKTQADAAGNPAMSTIGVMPGTAVAAALAAAQAGTMSPGQQTQLYQLVTEVGILERDDRIRVSALTGDVQQLTALTTGKLADFDRRLSMLEAQTAVSGAEQAGATMPVAAAMAMAARPAATPANAAPQALPATPPTLTAPPAARAASSASAPPAAVSAAVPPSGPAAPVQYQVQAASPGLAMLSVIGGDGSPMEVQTGDIIQGYGKVLGVVQQGNAWVVETASGNIE